MRKIHFLRIPVFSFAFICLCLCSFAQEPFFRKIDISQSTSDVKILSLCEDHRKVIWIGTSNGLLKFNGLTFERTEVSDSLSNEKITVLSQFGNSGVIGGTKSGKLFYTSDGDFSLISGGEYIIESAISGIIVTGERSFWVSTTGDGLFYFNNDVIKNYTIDDGLGDDYVYTIAIDAQNNLWAGTDGGMSYASLNDSVNDFVNINVADGLPENIIRKIVRGPGNTIGVGMEELGFCLYDYEGKQIIRNDFFKSWDQGPIASMILLENEFWIGTSKSGITDYEFRGKNRIRKFFGTNEFPGIDINCMIKDHEGNVWVGAGSELYFSTGENIEFTRLIGETRLGNIRTILTDKDENIWFSNENGLFNYIRYTDGSYDLLQPLKGTVYESYHIISLYEDTFGFIWIGTFDNGLLRLDPHSGKIVVFGESAGLDNLNILSIDGNNSEIWFATLGGVSKCYLTDSSLSGVSQFVGYTQENGLGNNFIYKVFIDSKNCVWFGTDGQGVTCYRNGQFKNYSTEQGLKSKVIYSIAEDNEGNMWFSSVSDGIYRFDGDNFRNFSFKDGLSDLNISGIATDANGNLVIINKKGVDILDPGNYQILTYGSEVGLVNIDPDINVFDVDKHGDIFAGISDGIVRLSFEKKASAKAPLIILDKVLLYLDKVDTTTTNKFGFNNNYISFSYFAVWYSDPSKVNYQYRLTGYNNEWISTGDRLVSFPNLPPGEYVFYVRASANSNFDEVPVASYSFVINPPFWNEIWFVILVTFAGMAIFYFYLNYRDKRIKSLEKIERERIESQFEVLKNQVNPHFLFNSFNTLISVIENDRNVAVEYVIKLSDFFRSILAVREKDLIGLKEELSLVNNYIFLQQKRYGNNFKVEVVVSDEVSNECMMPPLSLQILLENCLKHNSVSSETPLKCEIFVENDKYLVIRNNINSKVEKEPSTGIGLQNVRNRYKILTGLKIDVFEKNGYFVVRLPLIKSSK